MRPSDTLARLGGDEFTILLEDIAARPTRPASPTGSNRSWRHRSTCEGHEVFSSVSLGIALSLSGYERAEEMLRDADIAMYRAKSTDRSRHQIFDGTCTSARLPAGLETDLRRAIKRERADALLSADHRPRDRQVMGFEALARWRHPSAG